MKNGIVTIIQRELSSSGLIKKNEKVSISIGKGRQGFQGNIVFWVYPCNSSVPIFWGKTARTPAGNRYLENERDAITYLKETKLGRYIPSIDLYFDWNGRRVIIEEYIPSTGHFGKEYMNRGEISGAPITSTLIEFLKELKSGELPEGRNNLSFYEEIVSEFFKLYQLADREKIALEETIAFWKGVTPVSFLQHGDLWRTHILSTSAQTFKVIDWEFFQKKGFPLSDAFQLLGSIAIEHYRIPQTTEDLSTAFKRLSRNNDRFSQSINRIFSELAQQSVPGHATIYSLLIMHLVREAIRDYRMLLECSREGYLSLPPNPKGAQLSYNELIKHNRYYNAFRDVVSAGLYR